MKTYLVYESELREVGAAVRRDDDIREVALLGEVELLIDARVESERNLLAELEAVRVLLRAYSAETTIAAAARARREREFYESKRNAEPLVVEN